MKILLYMVLLAAVLLDPAWGTDVGKLIPVEVIVVSEERGTVTVRTDTGDQGQGATLEEAFADLKATAPGVIYLDTAEYLLLEPGLEELEQLRETLKGNIRVYAAKEGIEINGTADYLSAHGGGVRLKALSNVGQLPSLTEENGRYRVVQK